MERKSWKRSHEDCSCSDTTHVSEEDGRTVMPWDERGHRPKKKNVTVSTT